MATIPDGLVRIKKIYSDGEYTDISDLKIYYDSVSGQHKHRFHCAECDAELQCWCFDSISDAVSGVELGMVCDECYVATFVRDAIHDDDALWDMIDKREGTRIAKFREKAANIDSGMLYPNLSTYDACRWIDYLNERVDVMISMEFKPQTVSDIISYANDVGDIEWMSGASCK